MTDDLENRFENATQAALELPERPDARTLLELYALFKQATSGEVAGTRPGIFDPRGRAKHDAWARLAGVPRERAMERYVELVDRLRAGS
jgi:diazepam-binding inhibitor (GABA receptor modulating acyl-CoA-binding protein)